MSTSNSTTHWIRELQAGEPAAAQKLWKEEKRTAVAQDVASKALGYKGLNGPARLMLSAMKKYGLLEGRGNAVKLSDLAVSVLHGEPESAERAEAIVGRKAELSNGTPVTGACRVALLR